ncbi:MAG TPA: hypothetical protein VGR56_07545 [Nitrososphaerales archaeon]|nr:hypothetical protein [Nitrososphaerales archaeon]
MLRLSRQIAFDTTSLITVVYLLIYFLIFYWFYSALKRIEKTLTDIKKLLEGKTSTAS